MKVIEILSKMKDHLEKKGIESSRLDSEVLISEALGWNRLDLYLKPDYPLKDNEVNLCRDWLIRRSKGEPVAYIVCRKEFYGREFYVAPGALIPRPETEHLVDRVIDIFKAQKESKQLSFLDIGTGSGCISITLALEFPNSKITAYEISEKAVEIFKKNANRYEVADRIELKVGDASILLKEEIEKFDVIVANPPYISENSCEVDKNVKLYEPYVALFSGQGGMEHMNDWVRLSFPLLKSSGYCIYEIGYDQGDKARQVFNSVFEPETVKILKDYSKRDRIAEGQKN